ncbi:MAG: HEPN domain-containing protein [bacterium]|nr:HEPN domain-containing protein [bacterium]
MSDEIEMARQWLAKARNDLLSADNDLKAEETPFDAVCFHSQQAAEKLLKAYLVAKGKPYPRSHDLLLILERILPIRPDAERLRDALGILVPYAIEVRYPDVADMPSEQDAREARAAAEEVLKWLRNTLAEVFQASRTGDGASRSY